MDFIIEFFRGIDGWVYYTVLVINTILIFAIIGYLGEKNEQQLLKYNINTDVPNPNNGAMNMNVPKQNLENSNSSTIPKISATTVKTTNQNVSNNSNATLNNPVQNNQNMVNQPAVNVNNKGKEEPEKAPAVLVINSSNNNKDIK